MGILKIEENKYGKSPKSMEILVEKFTCRMINDNSSP